MGFGGVRDAIGDSRVWIGRTVRENLAEVREDLKGPGVHGRGWSNGTSRGGDSGISGAHVIMQRGHPAPCQFPSPWYPRYEKAANRS